MEFSNRTIYIVNKLAVSLIDAVEKFINTHFEDRNHYLLMIDDELKVSFIYEDDTLVNHRYDPNMRLDCFIEVEYCDDSMSIGVDIDKCDALAEKYAPLIEYGVINTSRWHDDLIN